MQKRVTYKESCVFVFLNFFNQHFFFFFVGVFYSLITSKLIISTKKTQMFLLTLLECFIFIYFNTSSPASVIFILNLNHLFVFLNTLFKNFMQINKQKLISKKFSKKKYKYQTIFKIVFNTNFFSKFVLFVF